MTRRCDETDPPCCAIGSILIVDDNPAYMRHVALHLERVGLRFSCAATHDAALRLLADHDDIRVMVLDFYMLGDLCGLVDRIRADFPKVVIVENSSMGGASEFARLGVHAFLHKPWLPDDLLRIVASDC